MGPQMELPRRNPVSYVLETCVAAMRECAGYCTCEIRTLWKSGVSSSGLVESDSGNLTRCTYEESLRGPSSLRHELTRGHAMTGPVRKQGGVYSLLRAAENRRTSLSDGFVGTYRVATGAMPTGLGELRDESASGGPDERHE